MVDRIIIFYGSRRDFEEIVEQETEDFEEVIPFMELIQHYNARLRPNESGVGEDGLYHRIDVEACVVRADDYASVLEHVLSNFSNIVSLNHDIELLLIQNPPKRVRASLEAYYDNIEYNGKSGFSPTNHTKNHHLHPAIHRSDIVKVDVL